jgi:hypothetical protein
MMLPKNLPGFWDGEVVLFGYYNDNIRHSSVIYFRPIISIDSFKEQIQNGFPVIIK